LAEDFYPGQSDLEAIWNPEIGGWRIRDLPGKQSPGTAGWPILSLKSRKRLKPQQLKSHWHGFCRAMSPSPRYQGHGELNAWRKTGRHKI